MAQIGIRQAKSLFRWLKAIAARVAQLHRVGTVVRCTPQAHKDRPLFTSTTHPDSQWSWNACFSGMFQGTLRHTEFVFSSVDCSPGLITWKSSGGASPEVPYRIVGGGTVPLFFTSCRACVQIRPSSRWFYGYPYDTTTCSFPYRIRCRSPSGEPCRWQKMSPCDLIAHADERRSRMVALLGI
jgi:hypothetical protein